MTIDQSSLTVKEKFFFREQKKTGTRLSTDVNRQEDRSAEFFF